MCTPAKAEGLFGGGPGGKKAIKAASAIGDAPERTGAKAKPAPSPRASTPEPTGPGIAELLAAVGELTNRLSSVEARSAHGAEAQNWMAGTAGRGASLLDPGRVPPPGSVGWPSVPTAEGAGQTAYQRTLAAARLIIGDGAAPTGPCVPEGRGPPRTRPSEDALREQVLAGGMEGVQATQLAILEALDRLQGASKREQKHETLEDLLWGIGRGGQADAAGGGLLDGGEESRGPSSKGLGGMTRLQAMMAQHPERCSALADQRAWRSLGADVSQTPWSMQLYAQHHLRFGKLETHQRMWDMLASFHALARQREWAQLDMRITQCLKACEQSVQHGGSWKVAWLHTGLPDSRGNVLCNTGLAHPSELAMAVQVLKDQKALDEALKKAGTDVGDPKAPPGGSSGPEQRKAGKAKGKALRARQKQHHRS
eukprot:6191126-Amphidinium_carterae.2